MKAVPLALISFIATIVTIAVFFVPIGWLHAETPDELQQTINQKNEEIRKLEEEANRYRVEIASKQEQGKNLHAELSRIDRTIKQLQKDISVTQLKIQRAGLEVRETGIEIKEKEAAISRLRAGLSDVVQVIAEEEQEPILAVLLKSSAISGFFRQIENLSRTKEKMLASLESLRTLRTELEGQKTKAEKKKNEAEDLKKILAGRNAAVANERNQRNMLLAQTKNQERLYQNLLEASEEKIEALEREVRSIEQELKVTIDPLSLPQKGSGILGWPLPEVSLKSCWNGGEAIKNCVTQFFGYTSFARAGGYGGRQGHNGMDFRASIGTPVFAAENGVVAATGDTDLSCRGASYGKWILIKHPNNLSTLYGHLSQIGVSAGQKTDKDERIGLSGRTGYATGPHLHFTLFATQAVEIRTIKSKVCGRDMILPFAGSDPTSGVQGYLDPLDYL